MLLTSDEPKLNLDRHVSLHDERSIYDQHENPPKMIWWLAVMRDDESKNLD
jgi:hypothetical protein